MNTYYIKSINKLIKYNNTITNKDIDGVVLELITIDELEDLYARADSDCQIPIYLEIESRY